MGAMTHDTSGRVPVTLVTGFLGSGKTTLVNRILSEHHAQRIAVIVNEFGETGIDGRLVIGVEDNIIQLSNGCLCCTVRGDLVDTLRALLRRRHQAVDDIPFERIVIETSGLASPGPAVQTLLAEPALAAHLQVNGVVTLVHAQHIVRQLQEHPEASDQIAYADHILLNHCDQCDANTLDEAASTISACNRQATLERTTRADIAVHALLQTHTWDTVTWQGRQVLTALPEQQPAAHAHDEHDHSPSHTCGVGTLTLRMEAPLDLTRLKLWLVFIAKRRSHELMRYKGILRCQQQPEAVIVQGVYQWFELRQSTDAAPEESVLVLIGRHLDAAELQREWTECRARQ
jgi:G3E family GTPase